ncbi:bacteriocin [Herbidospora cretacea]|nr:bacteriocin [Herbidospora cretacea]
MNNFENTAQELGDNELAEVTGGMWANYDWMNYDWRDAVIDALP